MKKTAIVLYNMGGPDDQASVKPFLFNLFRDPDIIKLPLSFVFQRLLAWWIVTQRGNEAKENYAKMGGGSPQLKITQAQAQALKETLKQRGCDLPIHIAMRYWHPFTKDCIQQLIKDDIDHVVMVSLYPHFSYTTTGSSLNEWRRMLKQKLTWSSIAAYCKDPNYLAALAGCIQEGLDNNAWTCPKDDVRILFSAHSLPLRHIKRTKDPYPEHTFQSAKVVMEKYFPNHQWELAYQSKVGNMPWLGPSTDGMLQYYAGLKQDNILMVPISFVSDHIETLVELDLDYTALAKDVGIRHIGRAPVMNTRQDYIDLLATLILDKMSD